MRQSATGTVVFFAANSVWQNTEGGGTTVGIAAGSAAPAPVGGTFNGVLVAQAFGTSGDMIFSANISGGASSSAYFRFRPGSPAGSHRPSERIGAGRAGQVVHGLHGVLGQRLRHGDVRGQSVGRGHRLVSEARCRCAHGICPARDRHPCGRQPPAVRPSDADARGRVRRVPCTALQPRDLLRHLPVVGIARDSHDER